MSDSINLRNINNEIDKQTNAIPEAVRQESSSIREHRTALLINDLFQMQDRNGNFDFQIGNGNNKVMIKI